MKTLSLAHTFSTNVYFERIHPHMPLIPRPRFLADLHLPPLAQPPLCLRYIMWALAATLCPDLAGYADIFYQRTRQYLQNDEMTVRKQRKKRHGANETVGALIIYERGPRSMLDLSRVVRN